MNLDARQRAMLDEMGVKVWWPAAVAAPAPVVEPEPAAPPVVAPAPAPVRPPAAVAAPLAPIAPAAAAHGAAILADAPRRLYGAEGAPGGWLIVADMPPGLDGRHGEPFADDAGRLLANMLRALHLHDGTTPVHLMRTHRGVASGQPGGPRPIADVFGEAAAALAPQRVLALGPLAAQSLLQSADPLGKLRGRAATAFGLPVVASYHPAYLLRNPADKARAWADLCLAAEQGAGT